jgi:hypothetical protein
MNRRVRRAKESNERKDIDKGLRPQFKFSIKPSQEFKRIIRKGKGKKS